MAKVQSHQLWWVRYISPEDPAKTIGQGPFKRADAISRAANIASQFDRVWVERKETAHRIFESSGEKESRSASWPSGTQGSSDLRRSDKTSRGWTFLNSNFLSSMLQFGVICVLITHAFSLNKSIEAQVNHLNIEVLNKPDAINQLILEQIMQYPEIRKYFYEGAEIEQLILESPETRARVAIVSEMFIDFMESFVNTYYQSVPEMAGNGSFREAWEEYFKDMFETSPVLCLDYLAHPEWYENPDFPEYATRCGIILRSGFEKQRLRYAAPWSGSLITTQ